MALRLTLLKFSRYLASTSITARYILKEGKRLEKIKRPKGSLGRRSKRGRNAFIKALVKIRQEDVKYMD
ncbi:hypothetical protein CEK25_006680 [Fusarium fujikuroi]|nr:hypothetical protein CEK25_006680 [Fusarium fujikuroi]